MILEIFLKAIKMLATFDSVMWEHICRTESKSDSSRMDCIPDANHTEQITVLFRHVYLNHIDKQVEGLLNLVLNLFSEFNLDIQNFHRQVYDNGSDKCGKHNGLRRRILDINNGFYVPYSSHSLNLVVKDAANISHETMSFIDLLSATRWSSRIEAIKPSQSYIEDIFDALWEISEASSTLDCTTALKVKSLALKFLTYKFIYSVIIWYNVLSEITFLSTMTQNLTINTQICINLLMSLIHIFTQYRTDGNFEIVFKEATNVANKLHAETGFPPVNIRPPRRKTTQFQYEHCDEFWLDPKMNFKVEFFSEF
ncbi:uncharacterized protein LOC126204099 [Schistocerca nitens]|uniref:uncharacterized protein LOC126204099 n=1 Tax=Schistocerca nitens TaxID=7011 RepID=UPI002119117A|nr:uncharacterized protein LOC126204099 [Schistocerca nitens]